MLITYELIIHTASNISVSPRKVSVIISPGILRYETNGHVRWVPSHHGMARPEVADEGECLQIWKEAVNILNKQLRTADKGWSSSLGVGRGADNPSP